MAVTSFQDLPLADRDREWDRDAHVWYDAEKKDNFTAYKPLIADVVDDELVAVPRGVMAAGNVMAGGCRDVDLPEKDDEAPPLGRDGNPNSAPRY